MNPQSSKPKKKDKFWKLYLSAVTIFVIAIGVGMAVFFKVRTPESEVLASAAGSSGSSLQEFEFVEVPNIYKDSLSKGFEDWSWDIFSDFGAYSPEKSGRSIKVDFLKENSGLMIHAPHFDTTPYNSIKISIFLPKGVSKADKNNKLFLEISDKDGTQLGYQLLSWYAEGKVLEEGKWYSLTIPLHNLNAERKNIGDISIVSSSPRNVFVDDLSFSDEYIYFEKWKETEMTEDSFLEYPPISLFKPYQSNFYFRKDEWKAFSGEMEVDFAKMKLFTGTSTNYGMYRLKGSHLWKDYRYNIFIDWAMGDSINLLTRYSDENFLSCSFFDDGANVTLYQSEAGKVRELDSAPNFTRNRKYSWSKTESLGVEVKGDTISCLVDGDPKLTYKLKTGAPSSGGVGIELWSPEKGKSSVSINKVMVENLE